MKEKLRIQCPCGYVFDGLKNIGDAVVQVRLHFELFHKDFLPFGITNAEVLNMLKIERGNKQQKMCLSNFSRLKQNSPLTH